MNFKMLITLLSLISSSVLFAYEQIGRVTKHRGVIIRVNKDLGLNEKLKTGDSVYEGDIINTKGRSFVKFLMKDDTLFQLGPNSKFLFEDFKFRSKSDRDATYNLVKGKLRSLFTVKSKKKSLKIKTPTAAMGIRGTEILTDVYSINGEIKTDIALVEGKLEIETISFKDIKPRVVNIEPGQIFESSVGSVIKSQLKELPQDIMEKVSKPEVNGGEVFLFDARKGANDTSLEGASFSRVEGELMKNKDIAKDSNMASAIETDNNVEQRIPDTFSGAQIKPSMNDEMERMPASEGSIEFDGERERPEMDSDRPSEMKFNEERPLERNEGTSSMEFDSPSMDGMAAGTESMQMDKPAMELDSPTMEMSGTESMQMDKPAMEFEAPTMEMSGTESMQMDKPAMEFEAPTMEMSGAESIQMEKPAMEFEAPTMEMSGAESIQMEKPAIEFEAPQMDTAMEFDAPKIELKANDFQHEIGSSITHQIQGSMIENSEFREPASIDEFHHQDPSKMIEEHNMGMEHHHEHHPPVDETNVTCSTGGMTCPGQ